MNNKILQNRSRFYGFISSCWLIVSVIFTAFMLGSCGTPRSVRSVNSGPITRYSKQSDPRQSDKPGKKDNAEQSELDAISEFESKIAAKKNVADQTPGKNPPVIADNDVQAQKRLPTLREQMQSMRDDQAKIKSNVDNLQKDVTEMKYSLEEIKEAVRAIAGIEKPVATKGPAPQAASKAPGNGPAGDEPRIQQKEQADDNLILPEEKAQKAKPAAKAAPATIKPPKAMPANKRRNSSGAASQVKPVVIASSANKQSRHESKAKREHTRKEQATAPTTPSISMKEQNVEIAEEFRNAMSSYGKKNFPETITKLNEVIKSAKDPMLIGECNFFLGESHFGLRDYLKALDYFNKVLRSPNKARQDDAQNKIAECNARTGKIKEAREAYQALLRKYPQSEFVPVARKMLQQL